MRHTLFIALFFLALSLQAQQQELFKGEHFIEVSGVAETEIDPNEITFLIRLREFEENKNKTQLEKLDDNFLAALKAAGIDKKRLKLADAGSKLSKLGKKDKDAFREKSYELTLNSAAEVEKLLEKLEPVKVHDLIITRIHHTDYEKIKLEVKIKALQAAKAKAEALLKAIGSEVGKPLMIREWDNEPIQPYLQANVRMKTMQESADAMDEPSGTEFKKIRIRMQVTAQFEIK